MSEVPISELHDHPGAVIDRAAAGEHITITRRGEPVVELVPAGRKSSGEWRDWPPIDVARWRADMDEFWGE